MDKNTVFKLIIIVACIGMIIPFAAQFVLPIIFTDANVAGAELWNQYVSIILGIVATIMSVVSLHLCFKSEEQSHATELRTRDVLKEINNRIELVYNRQEQIYNTVSNNTNGNDINDSITPNPNWDSNKGKGGQPPIDDEEV